VLGLFFFPLPSFFRSLMFAPLLLPGVQVLEDDKLKHWYLYRKWRVGNAQIGDHKVQRMDKESAISEFERLFSEKTGNFWEARNTPGFKKRAGKFSSVGD